MPRDNTNDPTDCAVICKTHGRQFITDEQEIEGLMSPTDVWRCPQCHGPAEWDDDCRRTNPPDDVDPFAAMNIEEAVRCARAVLAAYARGEAQGGEIEWDDVDQVFELAKRALPGEYERILAEHMKEHPPT